MSQNLPFPFNNAGALQHSQNLIPQPQHSSSPSTHQQQVRPANAQTSTAMAQNAQPPSIDMSLLAGVSPEQLALIARLFQSGALSLPPPPPGSDQVTSLLPAAAGDSPSQNLAASAFNAALGREGDAVMGGTDTDREEGELEEDGGNAAAQRAFLRPPPTGPRMISRSPTVRTKRPEPAIRASSQTHQKLNGDVVANGVPQPAPQSRKAQAEAFILEMHKAGFTFQQLSAEIDDKDRLSRLYQKLGLPVSLAVSADALQVQKGEPPATSPLTSPMPPADQQQKPLVMKKPSPTKLPAPQDRIQTPALMSATDPTAAKPTPARQEPNGSIQEPVSVSGSIAKEQPPAAERPAVQSPVPGKVSAKNDLIRQRLEALKAAQAARIRNAASSSSQQQSSQSASVESKSDSQAKSSAAAPALGAGLTGLVQQAAEQISTQGDADHVPEQPAVSNIPQPPQRTFSGLPGLFLSANPAVTSSMQPPPSQTSVLARSTAMSRPTPDPLVAASPIGTAPAHLSAPPGFTQYHEPPAVAIGTSSTNGTPRSDRPFGQSRDNIADESLVIAVSEDGDEDDMDLDSDDSSPASSAKIPTAGAGMHLKNFPPPPAFRNGSAGSSLVGTPLGSATPLNLDLQRKLQELEAAKKQLAEAQNRKRINKANAQATLAQQTPTRVANNVESPLAKANGEVRSAQDETLIALECKEHELQQQTQAMLQQSKASTDGHTGVLEKVSENRLDVDPVEDEDNGNDMDALYESSLNVVPSAGKPPSGGQTILDEQLPTAQDDIDRQDAWDIAEQEDEDSSDDESTNSELDESESRTALQSRPESVLELDDEADMDEDYEPSQAGISANANTSGLHAGSTQRAVDFELAPKLQRPGEQHDTPVEEITLPKTGFTPYESPLSVFRDFRYHPLFLEMVPAGHKTLTYTHKIDTMNPLCKHEAAGGKCTDGTCTLQHWRDMWVSDNDLLRIMGSDHRPRECDADKWREGLGDVIKEIREKGMGKDVGFIANSIAEFRRGFLGDASRVLRDLD